MTAEEHLARAFMESHPPRAAMTLEKMPAVRAAAVLGSVPAVLAARVLREMTPPHAATCLRALGSDQAAGVVGEMTIDDSAPIARAMDPEGRQQLLAALTPRDRAPLERVIGFPDGTAGSVMDPSVFQLPDDVIVADARSRFRAAARDLLYYVYVVDRQHRLVGVLDIPELMLAPAREPVSVAMHREVDRLPAWMPVALVSEHPGWHRYHAMPVVDEEQRLLGAIRYQTLRRLERMQADREQGPSMLTARALGELFALSTSGVVAGVAGAAAAVGGAEHDGTEHGGAADGRPSDRDADERGAAHAGRDERADA